MKIREIIRQGAEEERCQRKYSRLTLVFMSLAVIVFVVVNSIAGSVRDSVESLLDRPMGRVLYTVGFKEEMEEAYSQLQISLAGSDIIGDIFFSSPSKTFEWKDSGDVVGKEKENAEFYPFYNRLSDYICDGQAVKPEYGEVILPKYLYGMGIYDDYNYADTGELVGKEITIIVDNADTGERMEEILKVVGTYDNIKSQCQTYFLINDRQMVDWYCFAHQVTEEQIAAAEEKIAQQQEELGEEFQKAIDEFYGGDIEAYKKEYLGIQTYVCVYINQGYDMEEARELFQDIVGQTGLYELEPDSSLMLYLEFIIYMGNLISLLLLAAAFANILIMVSSEVRRRKGEFALKRAVGYTLGNIFAIFSAGKFFCFIKASLYAVVITGILILGGNYIIQSVFPFYLRYIRLSYDFMVILLSAAVAAAGTLAGMLTAVPMIIRIDMASVLKREEQA